MTSYATVNPATGETLEEFPETTDAYMEATVLTDVTPEMRAYEEELFGINNVTGTQADAPFGGVKRSGVGRELAKYGMDEFVNKKLIRHPAVKPSKPKS